MASGGPKLTIVLDTWLSDLDVVASAIFVGTAVDDVSDAEGPGRKCMLQLQPLGSKVEKRMAGQYVRFSNWEVAAFRNGGDAAKMVYGMPDGDSSLAKLPSLAKPTANPPFAAFDPRRGRFDEAALDEAARAREQRSETSLTSRELVNQGVFIQQHEAMMRRVHSAHPAA